jgi:hypothetical protein
VGDGTNVSIIKHSILVFIERKSVENMKGKYLQLSMIPSTVKYKNEERFKKKGGLSKAGD